MSITGSRAVFVGVAAVVAVAVLVSAVVLLPSTPGQAVTYGQTQGSATSAAGLVLTLQISGTALIHGSSIAVNVTEANPKPSPLNETATSRWAVMGLKMGMCYSSVYPFGVAVFKGHFSEQNVSAGTPLNLYPLTPCPLFIRYVSGYYFQPSSDMAVVLPGSSRAIAMASGLTAQGNYTSGNSFTYFSPGQYTVVAGDEWGALVFLYFTVS